LQSDQIRMVLAFKGAAPIGSMLWLDDIRIEE
jgi:hypothetical protein